MIIKKFVGKTEEEAVEAARKELGTNIVIMNVRPVKRKGILSFFKPPKVEVTVAMEEDNVQSPVTSKMLHESISLQQNAQNRISTGATLAKASVEGKIPPLRVAQTNIEAGKPGSSALEEKLDSLNNLLKQNIDRHDSKRNEADDESEAYSDNNVIIKPAVKKSSEAGNLENDIPKDILSFIKLLYNTLIDNEVDEHYANELTDEIEKMSKPKLPLEYALGNVYQKMVLKFGKSEAIQKSGDIVRAEVFIGPTGVGKTTTIAKLASKLCVTEKKKVALLTMDTYRIAAAEQLRTYASILEIPFRVIYSEDDLKQAIEDFAEYDYLMIDTAGHSLHNDEKKDFIFKMIDILDKKTVNENFLVMSATTKYRDLIEIADTYSEILKYKLIFTKIDETGAYGNIYNIRLHTGAPISYTTNGQKVPDDISIFDAQNIVKGLLGGAR